MKKNNENCGIGTRCSEGPAISIVTNQYLKITVNALDTNQKRIDDRDNTGRNGLNNYRYNPTENHAILKKWDEFKAYGLKKVFDSITKPTTIF